MIKTIKAELTAFNSSMEDIFIAKIDSRFVSAFPWIRDFHQSQYNSMLLLGHGQAEMVSAKSSHTTAFESYLIIPSNYLHRILFSKDVDGLFIAFNDCFFSKRYNNNMLSKFSVFTKGAEPTILNRKLIKHAAYLEGRIFEEFTVESSFKDKMLRSYLNILLIEVERVVGYVPNCLGHFDNKDERLLKFYELLQKNANVRRKTYQYAKELGVSVGYLNRIIKEKTGSTPAEHIRVELMNQAKVLLTTTNLSVKEIAYELGFENPSYFNTFFKSMDNSTPENYRQKTR